MTESTPRQEIHERSSKDNSTLAPNYKPRYQIEETTLEVSEKYKGGILSIICSIIGTCCCKCLHSIANCISPRCISSFCCGSRRRVSLIISISALVCLFINSLLLEPLAMSIGNYHNFSLAKKQSYGFFEDIPESRWKLLQKRVHDQQKKQRKRGKIIVTDPSKYNKASEFYQFNWQPDFTCPHEERVGTLQDGGKYVCDPHNIQMASRDRLENNNGNGCLIYTSSGNVNEYKFEEALLEIVGHCEIHVFSPNGREPSGHKSLNDVVHHSWGFRGGKTQTNSDSNEFKTFRETLEILGHCGKTIDVFSLDCEGCEFDIYKDLFEHNHNSEDSCSPAAMMQILVQVHGAPKKITNEFFAAFQDEGYVTFRKGPSVEASGNEQDYGFLKLSDEFFH
jgi:hypothetical protein